MVLAGWLWILRKRFNFHVSPQKRACTDQNSVQFFLLPDPWIDYHLHGDYDNIGDVNDLGNGAFELLRWGL